MGMYLLCGYLFAFYIVFRTLFCIVKYTKAYMTLSHDQMNALNIYVIGDMKVVDKDSSNWFYTVAMTIVLYCLLAVFSIIFWPVVAVMALNVFMKNKREKLVGKERAPWETAENFDEDE